MSAEHRATAAERNADSTSIETDGANVAFIVLVVVAVAASVVMLLVQSAVALKIALLAALWSAILSAFLVTRYRQQASSTKAELDRAQKLVRDSVSAGRGGVGRVVHDEETARLVRELKEEIASLRSRLEEYAGRPFDFEPDAIQASAHRIMEVEGKLPSAGHTFGSSSYDSTEDYSRSDDYTGTSWRYSSVAAEPEPEPAPEPEWSRSRHDSASEGRDERSNRSTAASQRFQEKAEPADSRPGYDNSYEFSWNRSHPAPADNDYETAVYPPTSAPEPSPRKETSRRADSRDRAAASSREGTGAPSADAIAGRLGRNSWDSAAPITGTNPLSALIGGGLSDRADVEERGDGARETRHSHRGEWVDRNSGRRRLDEHSAGLSVAELMSNLKREP